MERKTKQNTPLTSFSNDEIVSFNRSCSRLACKRSASARSSRWRSVAISEVNLAASELAWRSWRSNWILNCIEKDTKKSDNVQKLSDKYQFWLLYLSSRFSASQRSRTAFNSLISLSNVLSLCRYSAFISSIWWFLCESSRRRSDSARLWRSSSLWSFDAYSHCEPESPSS